MKYVTIHDYSESFSSICTLLSYSCVFAVKLYSSITPVSVGYVTFDIGSHSGGSLGTSPLLYLASRSQDYSYLGLFAPLTVRTLGSPWVMVTSVVLVLTLSFTV